MLKALLALMLTATWTWSAAAQIDLHRFWDSRCHDCHGHAGEFARRHLRVDNGVLVSRNRAHDLKRFIAQHEAGRAQTEAIYGMLLAQAQTEPVFQEKCSGCHGTAAEFARVSLVVRDGTVVGRSNGRPINSFLKSHGKLSPDEVQIVVNSLNRVLSEIGAAKPK